MFQNILYALLLCSLSSCSWHEEEQWNRAVLSAAGDELILVKNRYETKFGFDYSPERNNRFELWTAARALPEERTQIGEEEPGRVLELFYLHAQGYALAGIGPETVDGQQTRVRWLKLGLDGSQEVLAETSGTSEDEGPIWLENDGVPMYFLPDPAGEFLAKIDGSLSGRLSIEILDTQTLEASAAPQSLTLDDNSAVNVAWLEDGRLAFHLTSDTGESFYALIPGSPPETISALPNSCFWPSTSTSSWTDDGLHVHITPEGEVVFEDDVGFAHFGCHDERE